MKYIFFDLQFEQPIYGPMEPNFTDFAAPGVILTLVFITGCFYLIMLHYDFIKFLRYDSTTPSLLNFIFLLTKVSVLQNNFLLIGCTHFRCHVDGKKRRSPRKKFSFW